MLAGWSQDCRGQGAVFAGLRPHQRLLLFSNGSLTLDLELLLETQVKVEVALKKNSILDNDTASYLGEEQGKATAKRVVWLLAGDKKIVYAETIFTVEQTDPALLASLDKCPDEPLGKVLSRGLIMYTKERMEIGIVRCAVAAVALGISPETPLFARRYVLSDSGVPKRGVIKAAVTEVFSPEIIPSPASYKLI